MSFENIFDAATPWEAWATMVCSCAILAPARGPLTQYLKEVIENATMQGILNVAALANVQECIVDTLTAPASVIVFTSSSTGACQCVPTSTGGNKQTFTACTWA